jgi:hypothetical protein
VEKLRTCCCVVEPNILLKTSGVYKDMKILSIYEVTRYHGIFEVINITN